MATTMRRLPNVRSGPAAGHLPDPGEDWSEIEALLVSDEPARRRRAKASRSWTTAGSLLAVGLVAGCGLAYGTSMLGAPVTPGSDHGSADVARVGSETPHEVGLVEGRSAAEASAHPSTVEPRSSPPALREAMSADVPQAGNTAGAPMPTPASRRHHHHRRRR